MRGLVPGTPSVAPIVDRLPALYHDDDFLRRFTAAFDDAFAPVFVTLDGLAAYVDPALAPADFLDWLFSWVAVDPDDRWSVERRREIVAEAASLHRRRGTVPGLTEAVRLAVGADVEVTESGGSSWSRNPGGPMPGHVGATLHVRVKVPDARTVDRRRLDAVVAAVKPAHVVHTVEIVEVPDVDLP